MSMTADWERQLEEWARNRGIPPCPICGLCLHPVDCPGLVLPDEDDEDEDSDNDVTAPGGIMSDPKTGETVKPGMANSLPDHYEGNTP